MSISSRICLLRQALLKFVMKDIVHRRIELVKHFVFLAVVVLVVGVFSNTTNRFDTHRVCSGRGGIFNIPGPPQG